MRSSLVTPGSGKTTLSGLVTATSRPPTSSDSASAMSAMVIPQKFVATVRRPSHRVGCMPKLTDLPLQAAAKIQAVRRARLRRTALSDEDVRRRCVQARAAAERRRDGRRHPALGRVRDDPRAQRPPHPQPCRGRRRRRRDHLQRTRRRRTRGRQRSAGNGRQGRRRRRDPGSQPPVVPCRRLRRRPRRRPHHPAQQRVLRAADQGSVRARRRQADHLRR